MKNIKSTNEKQQPMNNIILGEGVGWRVCVLHVLIVLKVFHGFQVFQVFYIFHVFHVFPADLSPPTPLLPHEKKHETFNKQNNNSDVWCENKGLLETKT